VKEDTGDMPGSVGSRRYRHLLLRRGVMGLILCARSIWDNASRHQFRHPEPACNGHAPLRTTPGFGVVWQNLVVEPTRRDGKLPSCIGGCEPCKSLDFRHKLVMLSCQSIWEWRPHVGSSWATGAGAGRRGL